MRKLFFHASPRWNRELIFHVKDAGILPFKVLFLFFPYLTQIHHTVHNYSFPIIMSEVTPVDGIYGKNTDYLIYVYS